jgi:hypothetical protein
MGDVGEFGGRPMKIIDTTAIVTPEGTVTVQVPPGIPPGEYHLLLVIDEQRIVLGKRPPLKFPVDRYGPWPEDLSLRREDMYGEWGR